MEIIKVVGFAIFATMLVVILKEEKKEFAVALSVIAGVMLLLFCISKIDPIINMLYELVEKSGINSSFLVIILKVIGIAYLVELGKNICQDAGQSAIATKLEMAGKIIVVSISLPIFTSLISLLVELV
ncbi:stage iii sporulation protein ad putative [Clostridium sp. CAG:1219]|nr:stage iii sporulation protein ad putative [Clostridium sp. CAG:1219]